MIKLKKIINEGIYGKFWWMNPRGKLTRVMKSDPQTGHQETAIELLQAMGIQPANDVFKQMYDLGWLRVAYKGDRGVYVIEFTANFNEQPNTRQLDSLKDLADELQASEIRNSSTKQTYAFGIWQ